MRHLNYYLALVVMGSGVITVQVMAYLWILFLIVILGLYLAGIVLVEVSRDRTAPAP